MVGSLAATNRVAVVTGAARGLGRAVALELAAAGCVVAVFDVDEERGRQVAGDVNGAFYKVDVSMTADVDGAFARVAADLGGVDVLVNNAGVVAAGPHIDATLDADWDRAIAVMQSGVFYCMRAAARTMLLQQRGTIVNVSSIRGLQTKPGRVAYCAAKAAVLSMTKVAAAEWGPRGIRVNAVAPGYVRTEMWESGVSAGIVDEEQEAAAVPLRRIGEPSEVAKVVAFLSSEGSSYVNGAVVVVDGGVTVA